MKTIIKRIAIAIIGVFLYLTGCGILDNQDKEITQKNRATLSVMASVEGIK